MKLGWRNGFLPIRHPKQAEPVKIVHDAILATVGVGEGRFVPVLIVDTSSRPDIRAAVEAHVAFTSGDVTLQWGRRNQESVALLVSFQRPVESFCFLEFDVAKQGLLVDHILLSKGFYLQPGCAGDSVVSDVPRILIEVPDLGFNAEWDKIYHKAVTKRLKRDGLPRKRAVQAAQEFVAETRRLAEFRIRGASQDSDSNSSAASE